MTFFKLKQFLFNMNVVKINYHTYFALLCGKTCPSVFQALINLVCLIAKSPMSIPHKTCPGNSSETNAAISTKLDRNDQYMAVL